MWETAMWEWWRLLRCDATRPLRKPVLKSAVWETALWKWRRLLRCDAPRPLRKPVQRRAVRKARCGRHRSCSRAALLKIVLRISLWRIRKATLLRKDA